jgi:hypothetical protein
MAKREAYVVISEIALAGLPDADPETGEGATDPYVIFTLLRDGQKQLSARTPTIENKRNVKWPEPVKIAMPPHTLGDTDENALGGGSHSLHLTVFDDDTRDADDQLGMLHVPLSFRGGRVKDATVTGGRGGGPGHLGEAYGASYAFRASFVYRFEFVDLVPQLPSLEASPAAEPPRFVEVTSSTPRRTPRSDGTPSGFRRTGFMRARRKRDEGSKRDGLDAEDRRGDD